jgi:hypothetical protein
LKALARLKEMRNEPSTTRKEVPPMKSIAAGVATLYRTPRDPLACSEVCECHATERELESSDRRTATGPTPLFSVRRPDRPAA